MIYQRITSIQDKHFEKFWDTYTESFPKEERRKKARQEYMLSKPEYVLNIIRDEDIYVGFVAYWGIEDIVFVEHIAMNPNLRGKGYGSKVIDYITTQADQKRVVLEVEPIEDQITESRVKFYQKKGFIWNDYEYYTPYYLDLATNQFLQLYMMSYKKPLPLHEFKRIEQLIMNHVYTLPKDLS